MPAGILFILIWASAFTAARVVVLEWPPLWALAGRFLLAIPLLALLVTLRGRFRPPGYADGVRLMLMGVFGTGGYLGCAWIAMSTTPSGLVALLSATAPLFVAVGERLIFGRRLGWRAWTGLALGWAGVALLGGFRAAGFAPQDHIGILFALAGALSQAIGLLCFAPARARVEAWTANLGQSLSAALVLLPLALAFDTAPPSTITLPTALGMAWSVLIVGLAGYALYFVMLKRLPPATAAALQLLAPPVAALLGWLILDERLLLTDLLGGAVTLAGLALLFSAKRS